jgi:hypothetical protein
MIWRKRGNYLRQNNGTVLQEHPARPHFRNAPDFNLLQDYLNEPLAFKWIVEAELGKMGVWGNDGEGEITSVTDDRALRGAIIISRHRMKVKSVEEYLAEAIREKKFSAAEKPLLDAEMAAWPWRVKRLNWLARTLNQTEDLALFKSAFGALVETIHGPSRVMPFMTFDPK